MPDDMGIQPGCEQDGSNRQPEVTEGTTDIVQAVHSKSLLFNKCIIKMKNWGLPNSHLNPSH